jgi:hypothetical protein
MAVCLTALLNANFTSTQPRLATSLCTHTNFRRKQKTSAATELPILQIKIEKDHKKKETVKPQKEM